MRGENEIQINGRWFTMLMKLGELDGLSLECRHCHVDVRYPRRKGCRWDCHFGEHHDLGWDQVWRGLLQWEEEGSQFDSLPDARTKHKAHARKIRQRALQGEFDS